MKCDLCKEEIETHFLGKLKGTYVKDEKGKRHPVCKDCQEKHTMKEIKDELS